MATWDDVRTIAMSLPDTVERSRHEWRVRDKGFAWERPLRRADFEALGAAAPDGPILGLRVADEGVKDALIASDPDVFFTTPHFDGWPAILVLVDRIDVPQLTELVVEAWLEQAPKRLARAYLDGTYAPRPGSFGP